MDGMNFVSASIRKKESTIAAIVSARLIFCFIKYHPPFRIVPDKKTVGTVAIYDDSENAG